MRFEVLILGSSSATPIYGRHPTSQLVNCNEQLYLVDCGEGTQMQLVKYGIKINRIKHIFISHLHGDHYLGLVGLISSMHLIGRKDELHLYGPPALQEIIDLQFIHSQTVLRYPLHFHPTHDHDKVVVFENDTLKISSFPLNHRIVCTGFRFDEKQRPPGIDVAKADGLGIPKAYFPAIKKGHDYVTPDGVVYKWQDLTIPAPDSRSYAYCSDTVMTERYLPYIDQANLLYHEATFLHDMVNRAQETFHTTALQAGQVALSAKSEKLLIGHYSARYRDLQPILDETKSVFNAAQLALEGNWYEV